MNISSGIKKFVVLFWIYLAGMGILLVAEDGMDHWLGFGASFLIFLFSMFLMLGCSLLDMQFDVFSMIRFPSRRKALTCQLLYRSVYVFLSVSVLFAAIMISGLLLKGPFYISDTAFIVNAYINLLLTNFLLVNLSLCFWYSGMRHAEKYAHFLAFLVYAVEILFIRNLLFRSRGLLRVSLFFSWGNSNRLVLSVVMLAIWNAVLVFFLYRQMRLGKRDAIKEPARYQLSAGVVQFLLFFVVCFTLQRILGGGLTGDMGVLFGLGRGSSLYVMMYFLLFVCITEIYTSRILLFGIKNRDSLSVRYGQRERIFWVLLGKSVQKSSISTGLALLAGCIVCVRGEILWDTQAAFALLTVILTGWFISVLIAGFQMLLFLLTSEDRTFMVITAAAFVYLLIRTRIPFHPFQNHTGIGFLLTVVVWGVVLAVCLVKIRKVFIRRY